jgi:hypothetical protein
MATMSELVTPNGPSPATVSGDTLLVVFGRLGTAVGEPGSMLPSLFLPTCPALCTTTWRMETPAAAMQQQQQQQHDTATKHGTASTALTTSNHQGLLMGTDIHRLVNIMKGKRIITCVSTDVSRPALESFTMRLFSLLHIRECVIVSRSFAASLAYGHERTRIVDVGLDVTTCSFVVSGATKGCVSSRTLGLGRCIGDRGVLTGDETAGNTSPQKELTEQQWSAIELTLMGPYGSRDLTQAPLFRLMKQLPVESRKSGVPVVITGDALEVPGLYHRISSLVSVIVEGLEKSANIGAAATRDLLLPAVHSRPALIPLTGLSLLGALCSELCASIVMTESDASSATAVEVVHSRCPGIDRPLAGTFENGS